MNRAEIKVITYDQERLNYFTDLMKKAQKRYDRLYKKFANSPYLWEETELLNDAGRELQFYKDVIALLEQGYRKQSKGVWVKLLDEYDCEYAKCSCCGEEFYDSSGEDTIDMFYKFCPNCGAKMKGGAE